MVVLDTEEAVARAVVDQLAVHTQVFVVGGVDGVLAVTELQREERVLPPRHVGVHLDLCARLVQVGVPLAPQRSQVHLKHVMEPSL